MTKPRLGIPVTYQFSVRYLLLTGMIERLSEFCDPVVLLSWDDAELANAFEDAGAEVRRLPEADFGTNHRSVRRAIDELHALQLNSPTTKIVERRRDSFYRPSVRARRRLRRMVHRGQLRLPGRSEELLRREQSLVDEESNIDEWRAFVDRCSIDAVLSVTPYHAAEELLLRVAAESQVPQCASMISFDNPTIRGWIPVVFDRYLVWNSHNERELKRGYPKAGDRPFAIVGAPQFDFYWDPSYQWTRQELRERLGIPDRPIVLFGGGPTRVAPHEPWVLKDIDEAIGSAAIPGGPVVLFRRHPMDPLDRWHQVLQSCRHVVVDEPWTTKGSLQHSAPGRFDVEKLVSTLRWSDVHVNTASTLTVDGAVFDRPQIGPAYDPRPNAPFRRQVTDLYHQEHWQPIASSGGLDVAHSREELITEIRAGFDCPSRRHAARRKLVEETITYTDGESTRRVVDEIRDFLGRSRRSGPPLGDEAQ